MITKFRAQKSRDPVPLNQTRGGRTGLRKAEQGEVKVERRGMEKREWEREAEMEEERLK